MKRVALALLLAAAGLYALATALSRSHPGWEYVAAFAEAAMVGAIADWFAVVALFRHPLGLPIPHTAIIPANKDRIGERLAGFICENFLSTPQVLHKLAQFDPADRLARWLSQPAHAEALGRHLGELARYGLAAFDDARLRDFAAGLLRQGLGQVDLARVAGQVLDALTAGGRHQAVLDEALLQVAELLGTEDVQERITDAIAREIRTLRYVGLDQVAARLATRKVVAAVARTIGDMADDAAHPVRRRFDGFMAEWVERLKHDPGFRLHGEAIRAELQSHPALADFAQDAWRRLLQWLEADVARPDSTTRARVAATALAMGERLAAEPPMRRWINEQIVEAAPRAIERYREDIRRYIVERVAQWNTAEMTHELERHIGRDLQFIRINGTLVGGLAGLAIHAATQWWRG